MKVELEPVEVTADDIAAWEIYGPAIFYCDMTGPEALARHRLASRPEPSADVVERVARAIAAAWDKQMFAEAEQSNGLFEYEPGDWQEWEPEARAAIQAMPAEPAQAERIKALEAALKWRPARCDYDSLRSYDDAVRNWEARAKAALQGGA